MPARQHFSSGNIWEQRAGFSRAICVSDTVYTAGTIAVDKEGKTQGADCYEQCIYICKLLGGILEQAGSSLQNVVQVRAYLVNKKDASDFTRFQRDVFGDIRPVATCVIVSGLFGEGTVVELELVAVDRAQA
ncbi:RidA family protein [bacterium]|nr:RidA family protein [bacterium]